ncbi:MAG: cellulase family glycosylhydrolase [Cyanobacteria bacterium SZAS LIN-3]|nr:cellulase family glycosylhydrolase [Cyanobacteria bacterium SZAS LIN-3]
MSHSFDTDACRASERASDCSMDRAIGASWDSNSARDWKAASSAPESTADSFLPSVTLSDSSSQGGNHQPEHERGHRHGRSHEHGHGHGNGHGHCHAEGGAPDNQPPAEQGPPVDNTGGAAVTDNTGGTTVTDNTGGTTVTDNTGGTTGDGSGFRTDSGQLRLNGQLIAGVAVTGEYVKNVGAQHVVDELRADFPGVNTVRLATSPSGGAFTRGSQLDNGMSIADVESTVKTLTDAGFGVIIDNHDSDANQQPNIPTYNAGESQWFGRLAADLKDNSMVMYQTGNEPIPDYSSGDPNQQVVQEQQRTYDAIRAAGSNQVVAFDLIGGGGADALLSDPAAYNRDYNYAIDAHAYTFGNPNWLDNVQSELGNIQAANLTDAKTGVRAPIYWGEVGVSGDTPAASNNPDQTDRGLLQLVTNGGNGAISWLQDGAATGWNDPNHLTLPGDNGADGGLTQYGQLWSQLTADGTH